MRDLFPFRSFFKDRRGVSAVEFALIAPVMIALYMGSVELTLNLTADRKASQVANTVADLVTQDDTITDSDLDDIYAAARAVLYPFDPSTLSMRITSIRMDADDDIFVDWSEGEGMPALRTNTLPTIPEGLLAPMNSIIMVEVVYDYSSHIGHVANHSIALTDTAYLRPRRGPWVRRS